MPDVNHVFEAPARGALSVALIGPDEQRRHAVAGVLSGCTGVTVGEFSAFPPDIEELAEKLGLQYDVVIVDLDSDPESAFELIETLNTHGGLYLMAYSGQDDLKIAIRFMRAGAREFFTLPPDPAEMAAALSRASAHSPEPRTVPAIASKLFVFMGAKGGCGVTTIASNFAVSLAQESAQNTLLIDLGLPLGDAALNLGMIADYSIANAIQDSSRLDASFLASLLAKHGSGLSILSAPGEFSPNQPVNSSVDKLLEVARESFDYVVVDAGSRIDLMESALFADAATIYLVTQVGISELRNSNRMISQFFGARNGTLQIVLNRYRSQALLFDDKQITKALTRPAEWKIPDDYATARRTQNTAIPLALEDSPISLAIRQMARIACGLPAEDERRKKKGFLGLFK